MTELVFMNLILESRELIISMSGDERVRRDGIKWKLDSSRNAVRDSVILENIAHDFTNKLVEWKLGERWNKTDTVETRINGR